MRRLLVTVRDVDAGDVAEADAAWDSLVRAANQVDARAWRFRQPTRASTFMEFIEWKDPVRPLADMTVGVAIERLDRIAPGSSSEWQEAPTRNVQERE